MFRGDGAAGAGSGSRSLADRKRVGLDGEPGAGGPGLTYQDHLFVNTGGRARFVKISSIVYISAAGRTGSGDGRWPARAAAEAAAGVGGAAPSAHFARIHRSTIVNLGFVERMEQSFNYTYEVFLRGIQSPLALSRRYAVRLNASGRSARRRPPADFKLRPAGTLPVRQCCP